MHSALADESDYSAAALTETSPSQPSSPIATYRTYRQHPSGPIATYHAYRQHPAGYVATNREHRRPSRCISLLEPPMRGAPVPGAVGVRDYLFGGLLGALLPKAPLPPLHTHTALPHLEAAAAEQARRDADRSLSRPPLQPAFLPAPPSAAHTPSSFPPPPGAFGTGVSFAYYSPSQHAGLNGILA
jgi:hypothetical protein